MRELFCFSVAEEGPAVIGALFVHCRKMPCSGQRRHQSLRHQLSLLAAPPPKLPAVMLLQAVQLFHLLAFLRYLSRRATTPMERPMLLVGKMMVTFSCKQGPHIHINELFYLAVKSLAFKKQNKIATICHVNVIDVCCEMLPTTFDALCCSSKYLERFVDIVSCNCNFLCPEGSVDESSSSTSCSTELQAPGTQPQTRLSRVAGQQGRTDTQHTQHAQHTQTRLSRSRQVSSFHGAIGRSMLKII